MTEPLLQALSLAPGSQTAAELRDAVRRNGRKVEEFEVLQELRRLQNRSGSQLNRGWARFCTRSELKRRHTGKPGAAGRSGGNLSEPSRRIENQRRSRQTFEVGVNGLADPLKGRAFV